MPPGEFTPQSILLQPRQPGSREGNGGYGNGSGLGPEPRRPKRRRPVRRVLIALLAALLAAPVGTYAWADTELNRDVDLGRFADRPPAGEGTNYLIVGSDSRDGLSERQQRDLHTGSFSGRRTDSMMLLHTGKGGT
ncbi:MAG: LCP family protein, partial [Streptomyces sp.]